MLLLLMSALLASFVGRTAPLGLAKGTWPLTAGLVTIPVTARAEGLEPPSMSCMKNVSGWSWLRGIIAAAPVAGVTAAAPVTAAGGAVEVAGGVSSSRIRDEVAEVIVMARKRREMKPLNAMFKGIYGKSLGYMMFEEISLKWLWCGLIYLDCVYIV